MSPLADPGLRHTPLPRPRLSESEVRRMNTIVGTTRDLGFTWAGEPAALRLRALPRAATACTGWLRVRSGEHAFDLGLPALPEVDRLGVGFAGIEIAALPEDLLLGVLEAWFEDPLHALQAHGITLELVAWQTCAPDAPPACAWEIERGGQRFLAGLVHAGVPALGHLADLLHRVPPSPAATGADLPFPVAVELGRMALPLAELRPLAPGDVLLLPVHLPEPADVTCELWLAGRRLGRGRRQGRRVTFLTMTPSPNEIPALNDGTASVLPVDQLPVQLAFEAGQLELTVAELRTCAEGHTFELPDAPDRLVTIRANGREIGRGELVDLGARTGVRIVSWSLA